MRYVLIRVIVVVFILSNSIAGLAQFSFGIKGGLNYANQITVDTQDKFGPIRKYDWGLTFHAGVYGKHSVAERASIVWEVQSSIKGYKSSKGMHHLVYLTTPLLFRYRVYKKLSIEAGTEFGVLLFTYWDLKDDFSSDEPYARFDLGLCLGAHYDITDRLSAGIRYTHGVANVLNKNYSTTGYLQGGYSFTSNYYDEGLRYRNRTLQLSVGYRLNKSKGKA